MLRNTLLILLALCSATGSAYGQGVASDASQNYIETIIPTVSLDTLISPAADQAVRKIRYFDGLGRPVQTVQSGFTFSGKDLITYQEYDDLGRESNLWLPVVATGNQPVLASMENIISRADSTYSGETKPYSTPVYEASPLNRISEQYGPGQDWRANNKSVKTELLTNTLSGVLACKWYRATDDRDTYSISIRSQSRPLTSGSFQLTSGGVVLATRGAAECYPAGELYVVKLTDEGDRISYEFKDKLGQTLLTRQMDGTTAHDTYYVYDSYGNLRAVLPPMASDLVNFGDNLNETNTTLARYAYLYKYDDYNRCIEKKLPGADCVRYIYDKANRLIFTQDGEQRIKGEWAFNIPDALGRTVITGICKNVNRLSMENSSFENKLIQAEYRAANVDMNCYRVKIDTDTIAFDSPVYLVTNYYDNYDFSTQNDFAILTDTVFVGADAVYNTRDININAAKTLLAGTIIGDAGGGTAKVYSALYYDYRGRLIQTRRKNHLGGVDTECFVYTFTGQPAMKLYIHEKTRGVQKLKELYAYTYDHAGRMLTTSHQLNDDMPVILADNTYDELGRLKNKKQHNAGSTQLDYTYNVRSWLTGISGAKFAQNLFYNSGNDSPSYNGNISSMTWKGGNETTTRGYKFVYDGLSRLKEAGYGEGATISTNTDKFSEKVTDYDKHGNIKAMKRYSGGAESSFSHSYTGNQLTSSGGSTYSYDTNGSMTKDSGKGIAAIEYNYLSLPQKVVWSDSKYTEYTYDAAGNKLRAKHVDGSEATTTDYCGNAIYEDGSLSKLLTEEGYITLSDATPTYHYFLEDHLGNNRVVLNQDGTTVEQVNHYYPFGGTFASSNEGIQPYKFGGKELDDKNGLGLYDFSARYMDGAVGRFTTMDPLAEKYYNISPYVYCANNPIRFVDPDGMFIGDPLIPRFTRKEYGGSLLNNVGVFLYNTATAITNAPIDIVNNLVSETSFIAENGVGAYLSAAGNHAATLLAEDADYISSTPMSEQAAGFVSATTNPQVWENLAAGAALMAVPMKIGGTGSNAAQLGTSTSGATGIRYMSKGELSAVQETGLLRGGRPGNTYFTKDVYKSASKAQQRLSLPDKPEFRVEFEITNNPKMILNGSKVRPQYGMPGKGTEFMTEKPIKVNLINWQPLNK